MVHTCWMGVEIVLDYAVFPCVDVKFVCVVFIYTVWPSVPGKENDRLHTVLLPTGPSWYFLG
jgi:hypothetical protein